MNVFKYAFNDLGRNKTRAIFAIAGIAVSLFLLNSVAILNDSLSYSSIDLATNQAGSADVMISTSLVLDINFDPFFQQDILEPYKPNLSQIANYYPRLLLPVEVYNTQFPDVEGNTIFYGLNITAENQNGDLGKLFYADATGAKGMEFTGGIESGHCVILFNTAKKYNLTIGDSIHCTYTRHQQDFVVDAILIQELRFSFVESNLIITDLVTAQQFSGKTGLINYMLATLKNRETIYDARDTPSTIHRLGQVGQAIQEIIGFDYSITMPKLNELQSSDFNNIYLTIGFWLITFLSMLISGILINSILSTSMEERVREFGIFRTVGSRRGFNIQLVLLQGFIMSTIGTIVGVSASLVVVPFILPWMMDQLSLWSTSVTFFVRPETVLISSIVGISISLSVSVVPAIKTARVKIIEAIQPFRHGSGEYKVKKEGSANMRTILAGIAIATIGGIIFIVFPRVLTTGDMNLTLSVFISLMLAVLVGLVFASLGIIPGLQQLFSRFFHPFVKKYSGMIQTNLRRYQRRNTSTVLMFAIAFTFIFFVTTQLSLQSQNTATNLNFQYGADIVLVNRGTIEQGNALTKDLEEQISAVPGVEKTAVAIYNTFDVQTLLSFYDFETGESGLFDNMGNGQLETALSGGDKNRIEVGDIIGFNSFEVGVVAVDEHYIDLADPRLMTWTDGSSDKCFAEVFAHNNTAIIAKSSADGLYKTVGDDVRVRRFDQDGTELNNTNLIFQVVGVSGGLPGFWNFRSSAYSTYLSGFLVSFDAYASLMDWENPGQPNMIVDKIFLKLNNSDEASIKEVTREINFRLEGKYDYLIDDAITLIKIVESRNAAMSSIMTIVLFFTVVISLFGLLSATYSTILERTLEIGILRAIGMKTHQVRRMFLAEAMVTMLSAGLMGTIIGSLISYFLVAQSSMLTEIPVLFVPQWGTMFTVFFLSVGLGTLGIYAILRQTTKQQIMDIFRRTF
ncbi:MAG: ABC-type transport system, involved in lipoprotein release, permease component [Promethearchaeota archaeon CR_4]|nr:MAG: ABC-type transport system, involved in lipoprotein release, permease component [Candidatus Lokiarchaeota archaeon CR_4]